MTNYYFDHIHLSSPDPQSTADYYEKMFGAKLVITKEMSDGRVIVNISLHGTKILISQPRGDSMQTGLEHFGFKTDELGTAIDELKAKGVHFTQELTEVRPGYKISFLKAPEDVSIELQEGE